MSGPVVLRRDREAARRRSDGIRHATGTHHDRLLRLRAPGAVLAAQHPAWRGSASDLRPIRILRLRRPLDPLTHPAPPAPTRPLASPGAVSIPPRSPGSVAPVGDGRQTAGGQVRFQADDAALPHDGVVAGAGRQVQPVARPRGPRTGPHRAGRTGWTLTHRRGPCRRGARARHSGRTGRLTSGCGSSPSARSLASTSVTRGDVAPPGRHRPLDGRRRSTVPPGRPGDRGQPPARRRPRPGRRGRSRSSPST